MKPINAGDTAPVEPPSFSDSLEAIDVVSLDRLIEIRKENARLAEYRAKAEEKKKAVAAAVYARVSQDYAARAAALEAQSAPLRAQARAEYRKLKALLDALNQRQEQAQLQKDEMEFRHTVGELNDGELADKLVEPQRVLEQCASERKQADTSKARFIEALGSEEALEASELVAATPKAAADRVPLLATADSTLPPPAPQKLQAEDNPGITRLVAARPAAPAAASAAVVAPGPAAPARSTPPADDPSDGGTVVVPTAALVIDGPGGKEYPLTVLNSIGRSDDNRICLPNPGISRNHALITAAARGFMIKDLGSQNGTFVNGQRITEKKLAEGDTIDMGSVRFVLRTPWPPRDAPPTARGGAASPGKR